MPETTTLPLRDIHLPTGISVWPLAPGWWMVVGLMVISIMLVFWLYRRHQGLRLRREALHELSMIQGRYEKQKNDQELVQALSIWLRRVCISYYPVADVAGLTGEDWLAFLDRNLMATSSQRAFSEGAGRLFLSGPYQNLDQGVEHISDKPNTAELLTLCRTWLQALPARYRDVS